MRFVLLAGLTALPISKVAAGSWVDGLPIGDIGWGAVVVGLVWMLFTGRIVTRREADAMQQRVDHLEKKCAEQLTIIGGFTSAIDTSNAMIQAVMETAMEHDSPRLKPGGKAKP